MKTMLLLFALCLVSCQETRNSKPTGSGPREEMGQRRMSPSADVMEYLNLVNERRIRDGIKWFSSYKTRYYLAPEGVQAVKDLASRWEALTKHRSDVSIELIKHSWPQPSLKLTFAGQSSESIILGGHADSINTNDEGVDSPAPGADDNASGISVLTEIIKIIADKGYQPKHSIVFFAYAAEEVGLKGSFEIAKNYAQTNQQVKGVLQIDGTNYNGSADKIVLIDDYTNMDQNKFLGELIDQYLNVPWGYDTCGYACSDHYAWNFEGYPASFPAEAYIKEENPFIHTEDDTLAKMKNSANHSVLFAKLGLAYLLELDKK